MYVFISILILIASILLILIVLIQNSKGGGLASGFSSSNQIMGVRKTTDFLEKATWSLAGATTGSSGRGNSRYYYTCGGKQQIRILFENNIEAISTNNGCGFFLCYFKCKLR